MKVLIKSGKAEEFRKYIFLSSFSPLYIIVLGGLIAGVVITLLRFNYWKFIYPALLKLLPPILFIAVFFTFIYFFITWIRIKKTYNKIKELEEKGIQSEKEFIEFINHIAKVPQEVFFISIATWIILIPMTDFLIWFAEIADFQTIVFLSLCTTALALPASISTYYTIWKGVKNIFEGIKEIPWNIHHAPLTTIKIKVVGGILSALLFLLFFLTALHIETTVKAMKYEKAKLYVEKLSGGEEIKGGIKFEIDLEGIDKKAKEENEINHPILDRNILNGIIEKVNLGENILFDYLSPGVYIFFAKGKAVEGEFILMTWVEDYVKENLLIFLPVGIIIIIISLVFSHLSIGRYISDFFQDIESQIIISDDEFCKTSLMYSNLKGDFESLKKKYISLHTNVGNNYSQVYSELTSLRTKLFQLGEETRKIRSMIMRIISFTKDIHEEDEKFDIDVKVENLSSHLRQSLKDIKNIKSKIDSLFSEISRVAPHVPRTISELTSPIANLPISSDGMIDAVGTKITKRIGMMKSDVSDTVKMLSKIQDRANSILNYIKEIENNIGKFAQISDEVDKLRKGIVILSMNTAIVSARSADEETRGKISTIAKHMAKMTEDIKRIESDTKEISEYFRKALTEFQSFSENGFIKDIVSDIKAFIERVGDTVDEFSREFESVIGFISETKRSVRDILGKIEEAKKCGTDMTTLIETIEANKEDINKAFSNVIYNLEEISRNLYESEIKMERTLGQAKNLISKYAEIKKEIKSTFGKMRPELEQMKIGVENLENKIKAITNHVDGTLKFLLDIIQNFSE